MANNVELENLKKLFISDTPFIDVRAPVEFKQGSLPGAVNFPILNDEERALVGTTYKQKGQEEAVRLGYQLISGEVKTARLEAWKSFIAAHPNTVLYCFRGGKRSQITQQWLNEAGVQRPLIVGGYKRARQFLMEQIDAFSSAHEVLVLSGPTGSGKTHLIQDLADYPSIDLEGLAHHRGSAFGGMAHPQPTQIDFENLLSVQIMKYTERFPQGPKLLVEDESRLIGRVHLPTSFFESMRRSSVVWLEEPLEARVDNIFKDYILDSAIGLAVEGVPRCAEEMQILRTEALAVFAKYKRSLAAIQRKLGGLREQEILRDLETAELDFLNRNEIQSNRVWIEKLLIYYYDPLYLGSLQRRQVKVAFRGPRAEAEKFLAGLKI